MAKMNDMSDGRLLGEALTVKHYKRWKNISQIDNIEQIGWGYGYLR